MSAEIQAATNAEESAEHAFSQQHAPSSPIDAYGTPILLTATPPTSNSSRSQSSSVPRLQLASTAAVADGSEGAKKNQQQASISEEVDELDEFDSQLPIQLDPEMCEKLEAESLRTAQQSSASSSKKRTRQPPLSDPREVIDLREDSPPPPSAQPRKKVKDQRPAGPFFQQEWVQTLLTTSKGVRPPSPPEPEIGTLLPAARQTRSNRDVTEHAVALQSATTQTISGDTNASGNSNSSSGSSSDEDIPLATLLTPSQANNKNNVKQTPVQTAISKVEEAVEELKLVYERELACLRGQLAERELMVDQLRAKLGCRIKRQGAGSGAGRSAGGADAASSSAGGGGSSQGREGG
ncbi:uncharacterized protein UTRI_06121 [Ustilago trichophora]|uniref:Uncharacterized protein n=1 Tax=Ustilago trichophora TaxID=86804 RepID=A0A5C3EFG0_9BASI|nr:uncharacterized protein UTRI_06121 [Ustilago trichophora]